MAAEAASPRGQSVVLIRVLAALVALRALTDFGKPFGTGSGIVVLGQLVTGGPMVVLSILVGTWMLVLAWALWGSRPIAVPLGAAYVAYVAVNLIRFPMVQGLPTNLPYPPAAVAFGYVVYGLVAVGVPGVATLLVARRQR